MHVLSYSHVYWEIFTSIVHASSEYFPVIGSVLNYTLVAYNYSVMYIHDIMYIIIMKILRV